jgi:Tol biopolymer transport system component
MGRFLDDATGGQNLGPLLVVSTAGGEPKRLTETNATEATWFPDGNRIAYVTQDDALMTVPFDTLSGQPSGPPHRVTPSVPSGFRLSPDGRWFAYTNWTGSGGVAIKVIPTSGGKVRTVIESEWRVWLMDWSRRPTSTTRRK